MGFCPVCFDDNKADIAIVPCGHVFCQSCLDGFREPKCPVCRADIESTLRIYPTDDDSGNSETVARLTDQLMQKIEALRLNKHKLKESQASVQRLEKEVKRLRGRESEKVESLNDQVAQTETLMKRLHEELSKPPVV